MENIEIFLQDIKDGLSEINKNIKDLDHRLKLLEIDISKSKIYYNFIECNYSYFLEMLDLHKSRKEQKKDILNNILKNIAWGAIVFVGNLIFTGFVVFLLKILGK